MWRENMRTFKGVEFSSTNCYNYWALSWNHQAQPSLQHSDHHLLKINHLHLFMHINQPLHTNIHLSCIHCLVSLRIKDFLPAIVLPVILTSSNSDPHRSSWFFTVSSEVLCSIVLSHHDAASSPFTHQLAWTSLTCSNWGVCIPRSSRLDLSLYLINSFSFPFQPANCQYYSPDHWRAAKSTHHAKRHHTRCCIGTHSFTNGCCQSHGQSSALFWFDRGLQWIFFFNVVNFLCLAEKST